MLELLRDFSKTWPAKILLAVLVVCFGAFGINNVITSLGSTTIAHVGGTDITAQDFQRAYQQQLATFAQQTNHTPTPQEAAAMGIPNQVVNQLAGDASVANFGSSMGLGASDDRLGKMLRENPGFQNTLGQFDPNQFNQTLQQEGFTQAQFLDLMEKQARRDQLAYGLFADAPVARTSLDLFNRYGADTRTLNYFVLNTTSIPTIPDPTDADLTAYLKAHQSEYRTQETRTVELMTMSPQVLAATVTIPDDQIAAEYESTKANLTKPETRAIKQAVLTDAQAKIFSDGQTAGKSFDDLVKEAGAKVDDLGTLARSAITDTALADAAFQLKQGGFTVIPGIQGKRAITVTAVNGGGQLSLDEAKATIQKRLALQKATSEVGNDTDQIEDLRAGKQPLSAIAPRYNLKVTSVALTADGAALSAVPDIAEADRAKVAQAIFAAKEGGITPSVPLSNSQNVWFDLIKVEPARDQTLAEVRDALAKAWTTEKTNAAFKAKADQIVADLKAGKKFEDVAQAINLTPVLSQPISRRGDQSEGGDASVLDGSVAQAAFAGGDNHFGYAIDNDGDYVIFQVQAITPASAPLSAQLTTSLQDSVRNSLFGSFVQGLVLENGVRLNQPAIDQAMNLDTSGN